MTTMTTEQLAQQLVAVLRRHEAAQSDYNPDDNPFVNHDLKSMTSAGLLKSADKHPALNMAPKGGLGYDMEVARHEALAADKVDKSAKRMAAARARKARRDQFDAIADKPGVPQPERMAEAWNVVVHLWPTVDRIATAKQRWASRFLGSITDSVASLAIEKLALMLAKSDQDLEFLALAAAEIGEQAERTGQIPGEQMTEEERKERKRMAKARKWLMGAVNNRVMGALVDVWTSENNLRWDNIDIMTTVLANVSGVGEDPMVNRHKAERAPAFMGTTFQRPGGIDSGLLAAGISAAITERHLDPLVEFLLDDANRQTDGAVKWTEHAETIIKLTPDGEGEWLWECVVAATTGRDKNGNEWDIDRAGRARARAAMLHVRSLFEFLPSVITGLVDSFDPHIIGWGLASGKDVFTTKVAPTRKVETIRVNAGTGMIPSPNPNFDGTERDDVFWPETVGQPVGDEVIEEVDMVWHHRETKVRCAMRPQAVMASDFELFYMPDQPEMRQVLRPALRYADVTEAAYALVDHLSVLVTGEDLVNSVVNA